MTRPEPETAWTILDVDGDLDGRTGPGLLFPCRREVEAGRVHLVVDPAREAV